MTDETTQAEYTLLDQAGELAGLMKIREERAYELEQIDKQVEEAREAMHQAMVANGTKKVVHPLITVSRSQGKRSKITNQRDLIDAITERGWLYKLTPQTVTKIEYNLTAAKKLGLREEMPGVEEYPYDELRVRKATP